MHVSAYHWFLLIFNHTNSISYPSTSLLLPHPPSLEGSLCSHFLFHFIVSSWAMCLQQISCKIKQILPLFSFFFSKVLCNGPGTCVPICISALLLGILGIKKVIIVYVESICRVEHLSLSGKILFHLSDYFIVQWPTLKEKYPKSVYLGRIV